MTAIETITNEVLEMARAANKGKCPICREEVVTSEFKDELSKKEYMLSGMCQGCQDAFFDEE